MTKKLLQEYFELCPDGNCALVVMTENEKRKVVNEGAIYLVGVCQRAGVKNGNGRIYKKDTLRREVEAYQKAIKEDKNFLEGLNVFKGEVTYKAVADTFGYNFTSASQAI